MNRREAERQRHLVTELDGALLGHELAVRRAAIAWQHTATAEDFVEAFTMAEALSEHEASARAHVRRIWDDLHALADEPSLWQRRVRHCRWFLGWRSRLAVAQLRAELRPAAMAGAVALLGVTWWAGSLTDGLVSLALALAALGFTSGLGIAVAMILGRLR